MAKNKITQAQKREMRKVLEAQFKLLNEVIKPKPKYMPKWLYWYIADIIIDKKAIKKYVR